MEKLVSGHSTMSSAIEESHNYYNWIYSQLSPIIGDKIVEIGAGKGNMRTKIEKNNNIKKYVSVDIDDEIIQEGGD